MIRQEIRLLLSSAKHFIDKLPPIKQQRASLNLMKVVSTQKTEEQLLKEIKYQINFLKLTNPNIEFKMIEDNQENNSEIENTNQSNDELQQKNKQQEEQAKMGSYIYQNGQLIPGNAEKRMEVDYSNWYAGNVDPDDLKKHKELLDRQHFSGPFWEGKPMPKSILDDENPHKLMYSDERPETELKPTIKQPKQGVYEKVKR